jgi:hypothetical protein
MSVKGVQKGRDQKFVTGFRPEVHARKGLMFGIRQPLNGPIFTTMNDAENWCTDVMADHYDRRPGLSDARIEPFKGMVACGKPPDPAMVTDIERICKHVAEERTGDK